jgi:hypothetical protein
MRCCALSPQQLLQNNRDTVFPHASLRTSFGNIRHNIQVVLIPFGLLAAHKQLLVYLAADLTNQPTNRAANQPTNHTNAAGVAVRVKLRFG